MSEHTPGPWRYLPPVAGGEPGWIWQADKDPEGDTGEGYVVELDGVRGADARLIAAAPDLLAALIAIRDEPLPGVDAPDTYGDGLGLLHWADQTKEVARAAVDGACKKASAS